MTTEERFERIEHITAGIAEERRKDRDEYKALWRDTQRQLNEMGAKLIQFGEQSQEADSRLEARIPSRGSPKSRAPPTNTWRNESKCSSPGSARCSHTCHPGSNKPARGRIGKRLRAFNPLPSH